MPSLASDLACALDPVLLADACGFHPDPWQGELLRSRHPRILLNCSRQAGKSTTTGFLALHEALFFPPAPVVVLSPSLGQSVELFDKILEPYKALGRPVGATQESTTRLRLANGSRILAMPGNEKTIRGLSGVRLLLIDEAARVEDALYRAVRPMLAVSGGRLIALSTPFGKRGWWYEAWENGGPEWLRVKVPATLCPRISPAFLAEERRALGEWFYRQEYLGEFSEAVDAIFQRRFIDAAVSGGEELESW